MIGRLKNSGSIPITGIIFITYSKCPDRLRGPNILALSGYQELSTLEQALKAQRRVEVQLYSFFNLGSRWR
jgi:hypothetical protein